MNNATSMDGLLPRIPSTRVIVSIISIATALVYANTLSSPFVFDDIPELVNNLDVLSPASCWNTVSTSQNTGLSGRPFACLTFAANVALHGFNVRGFHVVNLIIHVAAALTLFGVVRRTLRRTAGKTGWADSLAGLIALTWAIHPLQTESVTYVIQRIESLAALLYLLTLYSAVRSFESSFSIIWAALCVVWCALGMLTKEIVVTAPLVVFLYEVVFVSRSWTFPLKFRRSLYVPLICTLLIPAVLISNSPRSATVGFGLGVTALDYLRTQAGVLLYYARLCVWPYPQSISYSDWPIAYEWGPAIVPGALVLLLLGASVWGVWKKTWWGYCGVCVFLILAPSSSFVPIVTEPVAERRMYLPLAAVISLAYLGIAGLVERSVARRKIQPEIAGVLCVAFVVLVAGALGTRTVVRNSRYASTTTLLSADLAVRADDELLRGALFDELIAEQRVDEARSVYESGLERNEDSHILRDNWARSMLALGNVDEAIEVFSDAISIQPEYAPSHAGLGLGLLQAGEPQEAEEELREAIRLAPNSHSARANLAVALSRLGQFSNAIAELRTAIQIKPNYADGHFNLALLLVHEGKRAEAIHHLETALKLRPDDQQIRAALNEVTRGQGASSGAPPPSGS